MLAQKVHFSARATNAFANYAAASTRRILLGRVVSYDRPAQYAGCPSRCIEGASRVRITPLQVASIFTLLARGEGYTRAKERSPLFSRTFTAFIERIRERGIRRRPLPAAIVSGHSTMGNFLRGPARTMVTPVARIYLHSGRCLAPSIFLARFLLLCVLCGEAAPARPAPPLDSRDVC